MDIAFSYYLTKKIEIKTIKKDKELKEKNYKERPILPVICAKCGQSMYWCQCYKGSKLSERSK